MGERVGDGVTAVPWLIVLLAGENAEEFDHCVTVVTWVDKVTDPVADPFADCDGAVPVRRPDVELGRIPEAGPSVDVPVALMDTSALDVAGVVPSPVPGKGGPGAVP